jgi:hypothetical protein
MSGRLISCSLIMSNRPISSWDDQVSPVWLCLFGFQIRKWAGWPGPIGLLYAKNPSRTQQHSSCRVLAPPPPSPCATTTQPLCHRPALPCLPPPPCPALSPSLEVRRSTGANTTVPVEVEHNREDPQQGTRGQLVVLVVVQIAINYLVSLLGRPDDLKSESLLI